MLAIKARGLRLSFARSPISPSPYVDHYVRPLFSRRRSNADCRCSGIFEKAVVEGSATHQKEEKKKKNPFNAERLEESSHSSSLLTPSTQLVCSWGKGVWSTHDPAYSHWVDVRTALHTEPCQYPRSEGETPAEGCLPGSARALSLSCPLSRERLSLAINP